MKVKTQRPIYPHLASMPGSHCCIQGIDQDRPHLEIGPRRPASNTIVFTLAEVRI